MRTRWLLMALALVQIAAIGGCGPSGPEVVEVRGKVTYKGQPVTVGTISFTPTKLEGTLHRPAIGKLDSDGTYALQAFPKRDGALAGEYQVSVTAYTGSFMDGTAKYVVPKKFSNPQTSGLKAKIPSDAPQPIIVDFSLVD